MFDIRTSILLATLLVGLSGALLMSSRHSFVPQLAGSIGLWARGNLLLALGVALVALRGVVPDFLSVVFGNASLAFALGSYWQALRRFHGQRSPGWIVPVVAAAAGLGGGWFVYVTPDYDIRVMIVAGVLAAVLIASVREALRGGSPNWTAPSLTVAASLLLAAIALLARTTMALIERGVQQSVFDPDPLQRIVFVVAATLPLLATFGFVLMCARYQRSHLQRAASIDFLTGIYNRRMLEESGGRARIDAQRHAAPLAVLILDIDRFKLINDRHGHAAGDEVLRHVAELLGQAIRGDDVFGRWGGEEFVVIMRRTDLAAACELGERIRVQVETTPHLVGNQPIAVTVSLGAAQLAHDEGFGALVDRADRALYRAKRGGRNRLVCADREA